MNLKYSYLLVDLCCLVFPLIFSVTRRFPFYKEFRRVSVPMLVTALLFITWDVAFTYAEVWSFNPDYTLGIHIFNLPIEEFLFFLCIPYACVFTYYCLKPLQSLNKKNAGNTLALIVISMCILGSVIYSDRVYTITTCISLASILIVLILIRADFLFRMIVSYIAVTPFFLIANGILTGMVTAAPIVIYNDSENSRLRIFTIPVEDFFYGMLLIVLNVTGYEWINQRYKKRTSSK